MTTARVSNNSKLLVAAAAVTVAALAAYGLGRIYPPHGAPSSGTIAPAERYQVSQVGSGDVVLGDTSVPALMQTDAFELMVKDPSFRALATNPAFMAVAQENAKALAAIAQNPAAIAALARRTRAGLQPRWRATPRPMRT